MDNHIKNKLKNHRVDWNKEDLLPSIESRLSKKKDKSRSILIFFFSLAFLLVAWGSFNTFFSDGSSINVEDTRENTQAHKSEQSIDSESNSSLSEFKPGKNTLANDSKRADSKLNVENENKKEVSKDIKHSTEAKTVNILPDNLNESPTNSLNSEATNAKIDLQIRKEPLSSLIEDSFYNLNEEHLLQNQTTSVFDNKNPKQVSSKNNLIQIENKPVERQLSEVQFLPRLNPNLTYKSVPGITIGETKPTALNNIPKKKPTFYLEPNISIGLLQRKIHSSNNNSNHLIEQIKETEAPKIFDAVSLEFGAHINDKWSIQIGMEYQEMREQFDTELMLKNDTTITMFDKAFYHLNAQMDTVFSSGLRPIVETQIRTVRHRNKHSYFTIPLNVSRTFSINKTEFNASLGISYAVKHSFTGRTKGNQTEIKENQEFSLLNKFGFQLGLGTVYTISDSKELFFKTSLRKSASLGFYEELEKSHLSYSIGVGFRFYL